MCPQIQHKFQSGVKKLVSQPSSNLFHRIVLLWELPSRSFCLSIFLYAFFSWMITQRSLLLPSKVAYFNYLADAFLHGQLKLRVIPFTTHDLTIFNEGYYLYWPPLPAVILMPLVAIFGVNFSDILFNIAVASLNTYFVALLLRRAAALEVINLSGSQRGCLVIFFALGTVHLTLAPYGRVWSTSQLLGFFFLLLAYVTALTLHGKKAFVLTGIALAATLLTRTHMLFAGLWPAVYLAYNCGGLTSKRVFRDLGLLAAPVALGCALLGAYNWFRFGSVLDNGLNYHLMAKEFVNDFYRYGIFSSYYIPTNFFYQYVTYPFPLHSKTFHGGSLLLLSPVFLAAFWGIAKGQPRWSVWALVVSIITVQIPILMLMGTGWVQFGPRYSLDFLLPLLLLTAMGIRFWPTSVLVILTIVSVLHFLVGTAHFGVYLIALDNL
jgi:hypothetical protein